MITAVLNQKGGTGKTTTTVNLGCALAQKGKKVLLIDLDPQANLSFHLGIQDNQLSIANLLTDDCVLNDILVKREQLHIIPATITLADAELNMAGLDKREYLLKRLLANLNYDYIFIDCPPSLSLLTINALTAADEVLIPILPEVLSIKGLDLILNTIDSIRENLNKSLTISGVLAVMVDKRKKLNNEILDYVCKNYEVSLFNTSIRTNVRASEAPSFGTSVLTYAPESNSAFDYKALAMEYIDRKVHENETEEIA